MLNGWIRGFAFAAHLAGSPAPVATHFHLESGGDFNHFAFLVHEIEEMILTGAPHYPVERTVLTTGALAALMLSRHEGGRRLLTPHLDICYQPPAQSCGTLALADTL